MKPFLTVLVGVCLGFTPAHPEPVATPSPSPAATPDDFGVQRERRMNALAAEHPLRLSDLNSAGLTSLEQTLAQATVRHDAEGIAAGLRLLEQFWSQAVALHNTEAITRIEADNFVCTDPNGALTHKSDDLTAATSDALQLADFKLEGVQVNLYGDTAVLTGKTTFRGTAKDRPFGGSYRWTDVFVQHDGHWRVVASQATNIAPPAGEKTPEPSG